LIPPQAENGFGPPGPPAFAIRAQKFCEALAWHNIFAFTPLILLMAAAIALYVALFDPTHGFTDSV